MPRVHVDMAVCEAHAQCVFAVPELFRLNDEGTLEYETEYDESLRADVRSAANCCPVQAITLVD